MAVGDAHAFPGFLKPVLTQLSFQSHRRLFSHASAEVRTENTPERKFASTQDRTHNHQVMSPKRSLLSHSGGVILDSKERKKRKIDIKHPTCDYVIDCSMIDRRVFFFQLYFSYSSAPFSCFPGLLILPVVTGDNSFKHGCFPI